MVQGLDHKLELSQNFFLDDNVDYKQQQQRQHFIPKKTTSRCSLRRKKRYCPKKVKLRNFLTNICYSCLKHIDFDNVLFNIDYFTYLLFNLNLLFLEFVAGYGRECEKMLWTYLVPNEFYILICKHDNFNVLNKLPLKYYKMQLNLLMILLLKTMNIS